MDPLVAAAIVWAVADTSNPWTVIGIIATSITAVAGGVVGVAAWRSKQVADKTQHELDGFRLSMDSMKEALVAANVRPAEVLLHAHPVFTDVPSADLH